jgi:hypothetical protein
MRGRRRGGRDLPVALDARRSDIRLDERTCMRSSIVAAAMCDRSTPATCCQSASSRRRLPGSTESFAGYCRVQLTQRLTHRSLVKSPLSTRSARRVKTLFRHLGERLVDRVQDALIHPARIRSSTAARGGDIVLENSRTTFRSDGRSTTRRSGIDLRRTHQAQLYAPAPSSAKSVSFRPIGDNARQVR